MINKNMIKTLFLITLLQFAFTDDVKECQDFTTNNISQVNDAWEIKNKLNVPQYYKINNNDFDDEVTKVPFYSQCSKEEIYVQSNNMNLDQEDFDENEWKTRNNYEYIFGLQQRFDTDTIIRRKITSSRNNLPSKCTVQFDLYLQGYRTNDVFYIYLDEDSGLQQINSFDCASYVSKNAVQKDPITGALVTPARKCYDSVYFRTLTAFKIFIKPFTYIPKKSTYYLQFQGKFKAKSLGDEAFWGIKNLDITCTYDQVPCLGGQTRQTDGSCACPNNTQWSSSKNQCDCLGSHTELNNDKSKCVCSSGWVPNPSLDNTFKLNCYPEKCPGNQIPDTVTASCICPGNTKLIDKTKCGCSKDLNLVLNNDQNSCVCSLTGEFILQKTNNILISCSQCPKNTASNDTQTKCIGCQNNLILINRKDCVCPSDMQYQSLTKKCLSCPSNLIASLSVADQCECPDGLIRNPKKQECICPQGDYAQNFDENGKLIQCSKCPENYIILPNDLRTCVGCNANSIWNTERNKCICPQGLSWLIGSNQCGCTGNNTIMQGKICVCQSGFVPVRKGDLTILNCRPIPKCNESCFSCVKDDDKCNKCKGNLEFDPEDDTICKCPSGLVLNENGDNCNQCAEGQIVNPSNPKQCICLGGQILNTLTGLCSCPNNTQLVNGRCNCPGANTQLLGRQCFCISDFVPVRKGVTSTLVCRPIPKCNESCLSCRDNDDFCVKCLNNLIPNPNDDTQCKCPEDSTLNKIEMKCYRNCTQRQMNDPTDSLKCICKYPFQINPGSTSCNCPPDQTLNSDGTGCETNIQDCASVGAVLGQDALGKSICICPQDTITKINEFTGLIESCDKSDVPTLCSKTCEKCLPNSNICVDCPPGNSLTDDRKSCQPSKCHPSCHCDKISKECASCAICTRCREPSMAVMIQQDYCACQTPQFVLKPDSSWQCKSVPQSVPIPVCDWQLFNQIVNMVVVSNCSLQKDEQNNTFVVDAIHYDFRRLSVELSADCQKELKTQVFIATDCLNYKPLDLKYLSIINSTQTKIKIPLIDLYDLNAEYKIDTRTIYQRLCFAIEFSNSNATIRQHKFEMRVFTNRDQVEVFHLDVSKQITEGCDKGQQCIIVADLDVKGSVCKDQSCVDFLPENIIPSYIVGDHMYVRIQFVDNTYKKFLTVVSVKFVDDRGIYNYEKNSQYWTIRQQPGSVDVNILLFQPQINARVEVQLKISLNPDSRLRGLVESTNTELITSMFRTQVLQSKNTVSAQSDNEKSSFGFNLIFTVLGLLVCLLI